MAKNSIPMPTGGSGILPKLIGWLVAITVIVLVVQYPSDAATWTREGFAGLGSTIEALVTFLRQVGA